MTQEISGQESSAAHADDPATVVTWAVIALFLAALAAWLHGRQRTVTATEAAGAPEYFGYFLACFLVALLCWCWRQHRSWAGYFRFAAGAGLLMIVSMLLPR